MADRKRGRDELEWAGGDWTVFGGFPTPDRTPEKGSKKLQLRRITSELHGAEGGAGAGTRPRRRLPEYLPPAAVLAQHVAADTHLAPWPSGSAALTASPWLPGLLGLIIFHLPIWGT
ncbi:hypothetical protein KL930_002455 [Ogataea haglerorum]|uniref:uncharacterized protein n=1 Tax=Ogataea haglerorum TaxID=1937702 RepID=UPI001C8AE9BE|nr:uncharacterized protein KL911_002242 [Ogataea haglerorum]KAG7697095.1 hypothetical protein KL915_002358 [Ogataea haglerorum]KAG7709802.1 hypothetical protein KL950_002021 [Ogataea haglerorum]KAG7719881.1 hypothetical protein KL913_001850 [Ogataea haglerorum]KAG7721728.1 hypothetical protein KL949_001460 [Ogataea haglerorum]KAG7737678.1 hypothetical protein KL932_003981 [Ogataea haglerorum]